MHAGRRRALPVAAVLLVVLVALVLIATAHWRRGAFTLGGAAALALVLRLVLSDDAAGVLAVRGRIFDVLFYLSCGVLLVVLADGTS